MTNAVLPSTQNGHAPALTEWAYEQIGRVHRSLKTPGTDPYSTLRSLATDLMSKVEHSAAEPAPWPELSETALYGLLGDIVRAIAPNTEADPAALLANALTCFGNALGKGAHGQAEGKPHHLNLYACIVGQTSKGRKGSSFHRIRSLFDRVDPTWIERITYGGLSSGEGLIAAVSDPTDDPDAAPIDKRLLVIEEEFGGTIRITSRESNTLSMILRQAWDGGDLRIMTRKNPLRTSGAHISIIGHVSRDELLKYLNEVEYTSGFANRFLWICARRSQLLPHGGGIDDLNSIIPRLKSSLDFGRKFTHQAIERDSEARELWSRVYGPLSEGKDGLFGAATSRAEAQVLRLSTLYAVADECGEVRRPHLEAAMAVWQYAEDSARWVFDQRQGDAVTDRILTALRQEWPRQLSRRDISNLFARNLRKQRLDVAIQTLLDRRLVTHERAHTGGRPSDMYEAIGGPFQTFGVNSYFFVPDAGDEIAEPPIGNSKEITL